MTELEVQDEDGEHLAVEILIEFEYDPGVLWDRDGAGRPASWTHECTILSVDRVTADGKREPITNWRNDYGWLEAYVDTLDQAEVELLVRSEIRLAQYD